MYAVRFATLWAVAPWTAAAAAGTAALNAYNVDPSSVSVSGLSSGGFMTVQLGVAYSDLFKTGFGVLAGGPYDCARSQPYTSCIDDQVPSIVQPLANMRAWSGHQIDPVSNLASRRIYMEVGTADYVVGLNPMLQLNKELSNFYDNSSSSPHVTFVTLEGVAHTFPTDFDGAGDSPCSETLTPYISNCGYDGAGKVLQWMYNGTLKPRNNGSPQGSIVAFSQTGAYGAPGMDTTGYLYVPPACAPGGSVVCKLHVALHGCAQSYSSIQLTYVNNTGYNKWADTNNIIILYPQTIPDYTEHTLMDGAESNNPLGCWDFLGYYGDNCDQIGGAQTSALAAQVNKIISGYKG